MKIINSVFSHKVYISGNTDKVDFFDESDKNDESITDLNEGDTVDWLFKNKSIEYLITETLNLDHHKNIIIKTQVKEPLITVQNQNGIGDIDAVLIPKSNPEQSVVIEFKRLKVNTSVDGAVNINKINSIKNKAISQIKKLSKLNYHQTYLGIIIQDDARHVRSANTLIRTSHKDIINLLQNELDKTRLIQAVGILYIIINQPTGENIQNRYNIDVLNYRPASRLVQPTELTKKIEKLIP